MSQLKPHPLYRGTEVMLNHENSIIHSERFSSFPFQLLLILHKYANIGTFYLLLYAAIYKVILFDDVLLLVRFVILILLVGLEFLRMKNGSEGNLNESVG